MWNLAIRTFYHFWVKSEALTSPRILLGRTSANADDFLKT